MLSKRLVPSPEDIPGVTLKVLEYQCYSTTGEVILTPNSCGKYDVSLQSNGFVAVQTANYYENSNPVDQYHLEPGLSVYKSAGYAKSVAARISDGLAKCLLPYWDFHTVRLPAGLGQTLAAYRTFAESDRSRYKYKGAIELLMVSRVGKSIITISLRVPRKASPSQPARVRLARDLAVQMLESTQTRMSSAGLM
jgi:hypothetical protein